jgi:hypothetical protein
MLITLFSILILGTGSVAHAPDSPFLDAYRKPVQKELTSLWPGYGTLGPVSKKGTREFYTVNDTTGKALGTLVLTDAQGRFDRFDLMVVLDPSTEIRLIRILKYRSEYGSEITNKRWLAQFYGPRKGEFILRKNIDAISGATFSSNGLVEEINAVLK